MSFIAAAIIGGVAAVGGAYIASKGASDAADAQAGAANKATDSQWAMYKQTRQDQMPWLNAGKSALKQLPGMINQGPGEFQESPSYQHNLAEGEKAIRRMSAARGLGNSGKEMKDTLRFSQGLASNEYQNFVNNWLNTKLNPTQSLAGVGQSSASNLGNVGQATAANMGNAQISAGNARASGYINQSNAINQGLQGIGDFASMYNQNQQGSGLAGGSNPYQSSFNAPGTANQWYDGYNYI